MTMLPARPITSFIRKRILSAALACALPACMAAQSILFIGNSFTFRPTDMGVGVATELNTGNSGSGVPALFQALAVAGGKNPVVSMETVGGKDLWFHYQHRLGLVDKPWDIVVLQDASTGPLVEHGDTKSLDSFRENVGRFKTLFVAKNPSVDIWLYETWCRPDLVLKKRFTSLEAMQHELHATIGGTARDFSLKGWVPVGDAFLTALQQGLVDNPATSAVEGPWKLWDTDMHHQTRLGAYLSALIFYGAIYGEDPRSLPADNAASRCAHLSMKESQKLQALAWAQLQATR